MLAGGGKLRYVPALPLEFRLNCWASRMSLAFTDGLCCASAEASSVPGRKGSQLTFFNPFSSVWKTAIAAKNTVDDFNFKVSPCSPRVAAVAALLGETSLHALLSCRYLSNADYLCRVLAQSWVVSLSCKQAAEGSSTYLQRKTLVSLLAMRRYRLPATLADFCLSFGTRPRPGTSASHRVRLH